MPINLEAHYDLVTDFIVSYLHFSKKSLFRGAPFIFSKGIKKALRLIQLSRKWNKNRNRLSIRNAPSEYQHLVQELLPKKIVKNNYFQIWSAEWPFEALVEELNKQFPDVDFDKLYEIHKRSPPAPCR